MPINLDELGSGISHHVILKKNEWNVSLWHRDQLGWSSSKGWEHKILEEYDKILNERKGTTHQPIKSQVCDNVITEAGMQTSIDRDIGVSSTQLDYNSIGTDATTEDKGNNDLNAEDSGGSYARKQFSVDGTRSRVNQTLTLRMVWDDGDVSSVGLVIKESGIHWGSSGSNNLHAHVTHANMTLLADYLYIVAITETQQNGTL